MSKKSKPLPPWKFAVGDHVRVKTGVWDPDYPDMPLGGWAGKVAKVDPCQPLTYYLVRFNRSTLAKVDPIYRNRCERDGLALDEMSLVEEDLEPDIGGPLPIEQPKNIITKPLSLLNQDDRLRAAFGLTSDDLLPHVDEESLLTYHKYLLEELTFPFEAKCSQEIGPLHDTSYSVTILTLSDPEDFIDEDCGLFCEARHNNRAVQLPLMELEVGKRNPNRRLLEDYSYWCGNWR